MCDSCTHATKLNDLIARFEAMAVGETDPGAARRLRHVLEELQLAGSRHGGSACDCDVVWAEEPGELRRAR